MYVSGVQYHVFTITGPGFSQMWVLKRQYCSVKRHDHTLTKEHPPSKKHAPATNYPGVSFVWLIECTRGVWEAQPQVLSIFEVDILLYFIKGNYKVTLHRQLMRLCSTTYTMRWCWQWHVAVQCCVLLGFELALLYIIVCPIICFRGIESLRT